MESRPARNMQASMILRGVLAACVVFGVVVALRQLTRPAPLPRGIEAGDYQLAAGVFRERTGAAPEREDVLAQMADLALEQQPPELERALQCWRLIPVDHDRYGPSARLQMGKLLLQLNRARESELALREFLHATAKDKSIPAAMADEGRDWLRYILSIELRFEERREVLLALHADGRATVSDSKQLYFPHLLIWNSTKGHAKVSEWLQESPEDPVLMIANARYLVGAGRLEEARTQLEALYERAPDDRRLLAALLECHYERDDPEAMDRLLAVAGPPQPDDPWLLTQVRAQAALEHAEWASAADELFRLLDEDPCHVTACMGLVRALDHLGRSQARDEFQNRALVLAEIRPALSEAREDHADGCERIAELCDRVPYREAAEAFRRHARRIRTTTQGGGGSAAAQQAEDQLE